MSEPIVEYPQQITGISDEKQLVLIVIAAKRIDGAGNVLPLTPSQAGAALANAKASLEIISGTEVLGTSSSVLLPNVELAQGETMTLSVDAAVVVNPAPES